jgi:peptidoglycan-N-acetylglucosamine deacetylase
MTRSLDPPDSRSTTGPGAAVPALTSLGFVRRRLAPELSGLSSTSHIALTYDDGPDLVSTPHFLELLATYDVRATFFVLGRHVADGGLLREMVAQGHEIGVHGWDHMATVLRRRDRLREEIARTKGLVEEVTGSQVRWYRPPYGWVTRQAMAGAADADLRLVLWSAWGRDWRRAATPDSVEATVLRQTRPGGTVLLHDSDRTSAPGSWNTTLTASRRLLDRWQSEGVEVGPLAEHWDSGDDRETRRHTAR